MATVDKYRLYCETESEFVYTWAEEVPTVCPNNNTHTIDTDSITIVETIKSNDVNIIGKETGNETNKKIEIIGGVGSGGFAPESSRAPIVVDRNQNAPLNLDSEGQLMTRGPIETDEGSFRDDFTESLFWTVTGTIEITGNKLTGTGTDFIEELDRNSYIKVITDHECKFKLIGRIESKTIAYLEEEYDGTTGTGLEIEATYWPTTIAEYSPGITVENGEVLLNSGTESGGTVTDIVAISREGDYLPMTLTITARITQRIEDQEAIIGFIDDHNDPKTQAVIVFSGTDDTKIIFRTSNGKTTDEVQETEVDLPAGLRTSLKTTYQIGVVPQQVSLVIHDGIEDVILINHKVHIPGPYDSMNTSFIIKNINPVESNTILAIEVVLVENHNAISINQPNRAAAIPVSVKNVIDTRAKQESRTKGHSKPIPITLDVPANSVIYKDWKTPNYSNGIDWLAMDFNASDVTSGDKVIMGKAIMGKIGVAAIAMTPGTPGEPQTIYIASTPGLLKAIDRGGILDEGFWLSFGTIDESYTTAEDLNEAAQNNPTDFGDDGNPNLEYKEYEIMRLSDQDENGVAAITLMKPLENSVAQYTDVNLIIRLIDEPIPVTKGEKYSFGGKCIQAGNIPAGATIRIGYRNNSDSYEVVRALFDTMY